MRASEHGPKNEALQEHFYFTSVGEAATPTLMIVGMVVAGAERPLRALIDTGATINFVRSASLNQGSVTDHVVIQHHDTVMKVRLATGTIVSLPRKTLDLDYSIGGFQSNDEFVLLDLDAKFDVILGMSWCSRHRPVFDWTRRTLTEVGGVKISGVTPEMLFSVPDATAFETIRVCDGPQSRPVPTVVVGTEQEAASSSVSPSGGDTQTNGDIGEQTAVCGVASPGDALAMHERDVPADGNVPSDHQDGARQEAINRDEKGSLDVAAAVPRTPSSVRSSREADEPISVVESNEMQAEDLTTLPHHPMVSSDHGSCRRAAVTDECDLSALVFDESGSYVRHFVVPNPPTRVEDFMRMECLTDKAFKAALRAGDVEQVCRLVADPDQQLNAAGADPTRIERYESQSIESLKAAGNPAYPLIMEFKDKLFPEKVPEKLPPDRGIRHEIDLMPGTKYCVTRQWPLPREQLDAIDAFFASRHKAGHVRESKSPHTSPTFCVKKATGGGALCTRSTS